MKSIALLAVGGLLVVLLTGCNEKARQIQEEKNWHEQQMLILKNNHEREMERTRHQNRLAEIAQQGAEARQLEMIKGAQRHEQTIENNKLIKALTPILALIAASVTGFYFWLKKQQGIELREIDKEEAIAIGKARFEAITKAIALLPENERTPLLEKWAEKGGGPLALEYRA